MKILIIEDDPLFRKILFEILENLKSEVEILGFTDSIQNSLDWFINNSEPDLIFLTTHLPEGPTSDLFKEIRITSPLIFMAQDGNLALNSFKYNTLDFLLRPITKNGVISALYKYKRLGNLFNNSSEILPSLLTQGEKIQAYNPKFRNRFAVHLGDKIKSVDTDQIAYFMADGNSVYLIGSGSEQYIVPYKLEEILDKLNPERFFRINRTFVVQITSIKETRKFFNGRLKIILIPSSPIEEDIFISRNRVHEFLIWLGE